MGVFHVYQIVQMVLNYAKRLIRTEGDHPSDGNQQSVRDQRENQQNKAAKNELNMFLHCL